jgi:cell division protein FtsI/penicillin-binding protein 2
VSKGRAALVGGVVVAVVAVVAVAVWVMGDDDAPPGRKGGKGTTGDPAADLAQDLAEAWQAGDLTRIRFVTTTADAADAAAVAADVKLAVAALSTSDADRPATVEVVEVAHGADRNTMGGTGATDLPVGSATATLRVSWKLDADRTWTYRTKVSLTRGLRTKTDATWRVVWDPSFVEPSLKAGETLRSVRVAATRGDILGPDGAPIVGRRDVVEVGIQKSRATDPEALARQVAQLVGVDADSLVARVKAAPPDQFVSVVTLRKEAYLAIRDQIQPLPGTVFHDDSKPLAPSKTFAQALLGTVGPATKEIADASKGRVQVGDQTGLSGLQRSQDPVLAGTAGLTVEAAPAQPGTAARPVKTWPAVDGTAVKITIDPRVQVAADEVMADAPNPAALVAIRPSTGDVLAVSNGPTGATGYNRAMIGHYPPGSTFKVATGLGLLEHGLTPDTPVDCPATITVGKVFRNAEGEVLGTVPFRKDFADSCNTAFIGQHQRITAEQLTEVAGRLGYRELDLGVPVFGGSVPVTTDATEHAANMIGQGKVEASPFAVALASASVAAGRSVQPRVIVDPAKPEPTLGPELPAPQVAQLRELMRGVVTGGTGGAALGVPGGDVFGKTGTAEFGSESPPRTHAWFTGFQGDLAFAVVVEDGGFGGQVAAPLVAQFLSKLAAA